MSPASAASSPVHWPIRLMPLLGEMRLMEISTYALKQLRMIPLLTHDLTVM